MRILKSWLTDYVKSIGSMSNSSIADLFRRAGIEVESVESGIDDNVVVAEILSVDKHPNADRLSLADVKDNSTTYKIVCGAPNIKKGQKVPLAKIGAILPGEFQIKKSTIRGVESEGMLCAADELGLGEDHSGIIVLPKDYEVGQPLNKYIKKETVFDISITPNRGDWLSHIGVARELAAFTGQQIRREPIVIQKMGNDIQSLLSLEVLNESACPQYFARIIQNVKVGSSPEWLVKRLEACGVRSVNNVVDITNYILLDTGHPLHAFDYAKIEGKKIIVRFANTDEEIVTLDGLNRTLIEKDLVIADSKHPIALAGIMGSKDSEVDGSTVDIVLEAAVFNPKGIRSSAKTHKLQSDASYRFERGIDDSDTEYVLNQAAKMITEVAGGSIASGILRFGQSPAKKSVKIDYDQINSILGSNLSRENIRHYLKSLYLELKDDLAIIPLWRHDLSILEDLAEEVGRMNGYDKITPIYFTKATPPAYSQYYTEELIKDVLVKFGFSETVSYPYLSDNDILLLQLKKENLLELSNPLQEEYKYLRVSLIPGLIKAVAKNPAFDPVLLFEISHVYMKSRETVNLGIVAAGKKAKEAIEKSLSSLQSILGYEFEVTIKEFPREELHRFKVKKPVVYTFECDISALIEKARLDDNKLKLSLSKHKITYRPISKYPMMTRDLAFIVDKKLDSDLITEEIYTVSDMVNRVELFDEFVSDKFGVNKKNVAYHIFLQDTSKTLTDQEADHVVRKIVKLIENKYQAELRKA